MTALMIVGVGGFLGSICRYLLSGYIGRANANPIFPVGTLVVNLVGCLIIGLFAGLIEKHHLFSPGVRLFLITGFLGGFTTFSAFGFETVYLVRKGELALGLLNIALSTVGGLGCVWLGLVIVEKLSIRS